MATTIFGQIDRNTDLATLAGVGGVPARANGFRLSLATGDPVPTSDQSAKTTVYLTPYLSNQIALYDGSSAWTIKESAEVSLALGTLTSDKNYDVFAYLSSGTLTLEAVAWTNDTTRATAITRQDGTWVKSGTTTRRYVGTFRTTSTTTTEDSVTKRFLFNVDNQRPRAMSVVETDLSWTYTTDTFRPGNNDTANRLQYVAGVATEVSAEVNAAAGNSLAGIVTLVGIGVDSTTTDSAQFAYGRTQASGQINRTTAKYKAMSAVGFHYLQWLERSQAAGTTTWYGAAVLTSGIVGEVWA